MVSSRVSDGSGSLAKAAIPIDDGCGGVIKQSLSDIGKPCSGPMGLPCSARYLSRNSARRRASEKSTSVTQLVYSCFS